VAKGETIFQLGTPENRGGRRGLAKDNSFKIGLFGSSRIRIGRERRERGRRRSFEKKSHKKKEKGIFVDDQRGKGSGRRGVNLGTKSGARCAKGGGGPNGFLKKKCHGEADRKAERGNEEVLSAKGRWNVWSRAFSARPIGGDRVSDPGEIKQNY